jgi:hypothetical protein
MEVQEKLFSFESLVQHTAGLQFVPPVLSSLQDNDRVFYCLTLYFLSSLTDLIKSTHDAMEARSLCLISGHFSGPYKMKDGYILCSSKLPNHFKNQLNCLSWPIQRLFSLLKALIKWLTSCNRALLDSPPVVKLLTNFTTFYVTEVSLPCSQKSFSGLYLEPDQFSSYHSIVSL